MTVFWNNGSQRMRLAANVALDNPDINLKIKLIHGKTPGQILEAVGTPAAEDIEGKTFLKEVNSFRELFGRSS